MRYSLRKNLTTFVLAGSSSLVFNSLAIAQDSVNSVEIDGTTFSYSDVGSYSSLRVQDARGVLTYFDYNEFGQLIKEESAERGSIEYDYDENGNIIRQRSEGGQIVKRLYDDQNRLSREVIKEHGIDRKVTRYSYDNCDNGIGRLCSINSNGNVTRYDYNSDGKFTRISTLFSGESSFETTRYYYKKGGGLDRMRYPTGLVVRYHYGDSGHVNRITARYETGQDDTESFVIAKNIRVNPETGTLTNLKFGNGLKLKQTYDENFSLLTSKLHDKDVRLASFAYTRDEGGNVIEIDRQDDRLDTLYSYDEDQRLIVEEIGSKTTTGRKITYGYDAVDNRTSREEDLNSVAYTYAATANRLDQINRRSLRYDARGNLLEDKKQKRRFEYDVTNRMTAFYKDGALKASYDYNAKGHRISKTLHGDLGADHYKTLHFAYAPDGNLLSEFGRNADKTRRFARDYIWFGNVPIAQVERKVRPNGTTRKAKVSYIHVDHLNAPYSASDEVGNMTWEWNRDAYGVGQANRDVDGDGDNTGIRLRFPGQYYDRESQFFYNHHRDYDPKTGRYIQSDPVGLRGGINRYAYVGGNPVNYTDPNGLLPTISISPTNCHYYDYYSNGDYSHSSPVECDYEIDVQNNSSSSLTGNGLLYANSGGGPTNLDDLIEEFLCKAALSSMLDKVPETEITKAAMRAAARALGNTDWDPNNGTFMVLANVDYGVATVAGVSAGFWYRGDYSDYGFVTSLQAGVGFDTDFGVSAFYANNRDNPSGWGTGIEIGAGPIDGYFSASDLNFDVDFYIGVGVSATLNPSVSITGNLTSSDSCASRLLQ